MGKTSVSRALTQRIGAFAVSKLNPMFTRVPDEHVNWYFERQVGRRRIAEDRAIDLLVLLDGLVEWLSEHAPPESMPYGA